MAYEKKTWVDRQVEFPGRRKLTAAGAPDVYDVSRDEGLEIEAGDALNAANLNNLENRIAAEMDAKSNKSTIITTTLVAGTWTGTAKPFQYVLAVAGVTATSNQDILPALGITEAQLKALQDANIQDHAQAAGSITLRAWGKKPTVDIPIRVIVRGDT